MERLMERLAIARKALQNLVDILREPKSDVVRDVAIERLEYTFEST